MDLFPCPKSRESTLQANTGAQHLFRPSFMLALRKSEVLRAWCMYCGCALNKSCPRRLSANPAFGSNGSFGPYYMMNLGLRFVVVPSSVLQLVHSLDASSPPSDASDILLVEPNSSKAKRGQVIWFSQLLQLPVGPAIRPNGQPIFVTTSLNKVIAP
eukprot:1181158-Prorocentrum_minimum.AAC.2